MLPRSILQPVMALTLMSGAFTSASWAKSQPNSSTRLVAMRAEQKTVLVTGATGKTGKLVTEKLKTSSDFAVRALTRSEGVRARTSCKIASSLPLFQGMPNPRVAAHGF
jgi:NADPH:quinone reductase-like Zn-dependent oxidoreductase